MPQHKATVAPIRIHYLDESSQVNVLRTVGYRASCSCGWEGGNRREWTTARADRIEHLRPGRVSVDPALAD